MSRKIIKKQTLTNKQEREEIAHLSASAKKDVQNSKELVANYSERVTALIKDIQTETKEYEDIHKKLSSIKKDEETERASLETNLQNIQEAFRTEKELSGKIENKNTELRDLNSEIQDYRVKLSSVKKEIEDLLTKETVTNKCLESTKKEIQTVKDQSGEIHKQTVSLIDKSKRLQENIDSLNSELISRKSSFEEDMKAADVKIIHAQELLSQINVETALKNDNLSKITAEIKEKVQAFVTERNDLDIYRGHNIRLLNELKIKVKEAKAYREDRIIGEYLSKKGL